MAYALNRIPRSELTEEICRVAVSKIPVSLKYVPEQFQTESVLTAAFAAEKASQIRDTLMTMTSLVHVIKPDLGVYLRSVENNAFSINVIPDEIKTDEFMRMAITINPHVLTAVENQTYIICMMGVQAVPAGLAYIRIQTRELCLISSMKYISGFQFIRDNAHRKYVARIILMMKLKSLLALGLSLALLVEVVSATERKCSLRRVYPKERPVGWRSFSEETLSLTELWALVGVIRASRSN